MTVDVAVRVERVWFGCDACGWSAEGEPPVVTGLTGGHLLPVLLGLLVSVDDGLASWWLRSGARAVTVTRP